MLGYALPPPPSRPPFPLLGTPGFPEPLPPTKAVVQLALISNVTPFRTKDSLASHSNVFGVIRSSQTWYQ